MCKGKELIYIWINKDTNKCFNKMGFNFSPQYDISFDALKRVLYINETQEINIFHRDNLLNITAVIGENGTGKTTLLRFLTSLSNIPFSAASPGYEVWQEHENALREFIAVYSDGETHSVKIINNTMKTITYREKDIPPYSRDKFRTENYIGNISHIYISNSEYTANLNMRSGVIDYISLTNDALGHIFLDFFKLIFNASSKTFDSSAFDALQLFLAKAMTSRKAQALLDLMYQNYVCTKTKGWNGKKIDTVSFSLDHILRIISDEKRQAKFCDTGYFSKEYIELFYKAANNELSKLSLQGKNEENLIVNLICELVFSYNFRLCEEEKGRKITLENAFSQCVDYIHGIKEESQKRYYLFAVEEIKTLSSLVTDSVKSDNHLPQEDLGRQEFFATKTEKLWNCVKRSIDEKKSFALKYLNITNFEMSSGERALLNFTSRIFFSSKIEWFMGEKGFKFNKNVLVLIDEIDLYLHPEWQRRILLDLVNELEKNFKEHYFQIILSSHSPIVLSDIPCKNSIYLKRNDLDGQIIQEPHYIQTFGTNIHTLYKDAFFMKDGVAIGEYAKQYINQLFRDIQNKQITTKEAERRIALIGEPIIQKKLHQIAGEATLEKLPIQERKQMIDFLKRQKSEIERQIEALKGGRE